MKLFTILASFALLCAAVLADRYNEALDGLPHPNSIPVKISHNGIKGLMKHELKVVIHKDDLSGGVSAEMDGTLSFHVSKIQPQSSEIHVSLFEDGFTPVVIPIQNAKFEGYVIKTSRVTEKKVIVILEKYKPAEWRLTTSTSDQ